jgi:hypothetical protein
VLTYEAASFLPAVGEVAPCRRHGYCSVASQDRADDRTLRDQGHTFERRSQAELLDFLSRRPVASVHVLRRNRFPLRLVAAAEKAGLVDVDLPTGQVALREAGPS